MFVKYPSVTGMVEIVAIPPEWEQVMLDLEREEKRNDRQYRRKNYSLDSIVYEGDEYGCKDKYFQDDELQKMNDRIEEIKHVLTPTQRRRVELLCNRMTLQEIADTEGVKKQTIYDSLVSVRKKVERLRRKYPDKLA